MKFLVSAHEMRSFEIAVDAETLEEAMCIISNDPSGYIKDNEMGDYVDGSFEVSRDSTECISGKDYIRELLTYDWEAGLSDDASIQEQDSRFRLRMEVSSTYNSIHKEAYKNLVLNNISDKEIARWNEQRAIYKKAYNIE